MVLPYHGNRWDRLRNHDYRDNGDVPAFSPCKKRGGGDVVQHAEPDDRSNVDDFHLRDRVERRHEPGDSAAPSDEHGNAEQVN